MPGASPSMMTAAYLAKPGLMEVGPVPRPEPAEGELLVKVARAAICGSDLHAIFEGLGSLLGEGDPAPGRPGHEAVGTVVQSRAAEFSEGDRVLVLPAGAFAQYMSVPAQMCVLLPPGAPMDAMLMAQQLGVTYFGMERFWPQSLGPGGTVTLIGAGSIGLHFLSLLKRVWAFERVIVADVLPDRLALARRLGADATVLVPAASVTEATMAATGGVGADLVIEAVGLDSTRTEAIRSVREYGRVGLFGYPESYGLAPFPFSDAFWKAPVTIEVVKGAQQVPELPAFHAAIDLIASGKVDISHFLGIEYRLAAINDALALARLGGAVKVQVLPD
jgi:L-iditol 2-dehydrogenase